MAQEKILAGVPKPQYGSYGGITPFPICLKTVSDYLGDDLDYAYAIVACGGAFRLVWDTSCWNAGNVDIGHTYSDYETPYRFGVSALGRKFDMVWKEGNSWGRPGGVPKCDVITFIKGQIDAGKPLISLGPVGPAEAGIITGYRDGGGTLLGCSLFQDWVWKAFSEDGYFIIDDWWEESDFQGVMSFGDVSAPRWDAKTIIQNAVAALGGRMEGSYAKGVAAYAPWKKALLGAGDDDFAMTEWGQDSVMMCQGDATDCLVDGRRHAGMFFKRLADGNPEQPLYGEIASQFGIIAATVQNKIYGILGGHERGSKQSEKLRQIETRRHIGACIDEMQAADEKALALMKELLTEK